MNDYVDYIIKAVIGILIAILSGLVSKALNRIDKHEERLNQLDTAIQLNSERDKLNEKAEERLINKELEFIKSGMAKLETAMNNIYQAIVSKLK